MKLPSIEQVLMGSKRAGARFPLVLVTAAMGTAAALILTDYEGPAGESIFFNLLFAGILGIPLFTTLVLLAEKHKWGRSSTAVVQAFGLVLLAAYALSVPSDLTGAPLVHVQRLLLLVVALHLLVAIAPFAGAGQVNGFWQYNKALLFRFLLAVLYSIVLYIGLAIALAALKHLFGLNVPPKRYAELGLLIFGIFTTWFFLAGVPEDLQGLDRVSEYPRGLKIFTQYILSPLVLLYLVILYAYLAKITIQWNWPQGWVSKLIIGFSATGILSLLLFHPIREKAENAWIRIGGRWFWYIMIPLVVALLLAIMRRVTDYGVTQARYIALACGVWLAGIVIYFIVSKAKSIKAIPASLCIVSLVITFGPWGTFHVAEQSQACQLHELLTRDDLLVDGKVHKAQAAVSYADARRISSIVTYLHDIHGYDQIQRWFGDSLRQDSAGDGVRYKDPALVTTMMGIEYVKPVFYSEEGELLLRADQEGAIDIAGYDRMLVAQQVDNTLRSRDCPKDGIGYRVDTGLSVITVALLNGTAVSDSLQIDLRHLVNVILQDSTRDGRSVLPRERLTMTAEGPDLSLKICLRWVQLKREKGELRLTTCIFDLLYTRRTPV